MTEQRSKVHLSPWLLLLDVIGLLVLIVGVHDVMHPELAWAAMHLPFANGEYALLAGGVVLLLLSAVTMVRQFSGAGLLAADDFK